MIFSWVLLLLEGFICSIFKSQIVENDDMLCAVIIVINAASVITAIMTSKKDTQYQRLILGGFAFRMCLMIWDLKFRSIFVLPNSGLDTETFALGARNGYLFGEFGRSGTYGKCIASVYSLFGVQRPIAQYMNVLLSISILYLLIRIMDKLKIDKATGRTVVTLSCFLPNYSITNSILLRETVIIFLVTLSVYLFMDWLMHPRLSVLSLSAVTCCLGALFHSGAIAVLLGEAIVYILYDKEKRTIHFNSNSLFSIAMVVALFIVLQSTVGNSIFAKFGGVDSVEDVVSTADRYNAGGSAYDAGFKLNNSIASLIINTPIRMFYFVASPVPWNWRGLSDVIAFVFSSMVFLYIYYYAYKELRRGNNANKTLIIVFAILTLSSALIFAWGVSNAGTAVRHREKFIMIYMLLYVVSRAGHREIVPKEGGRVETDMLPFGRHYTERRN